MSSNTTARGYGWDHQRERDRVKTRMKANGGAVCWRCGEWISPDEPWDLGHDDVDRSAYRGPEHRGCNRGTNRGHRDAAPRRLAPALRYMNNGTEVDGVLCIFVENGAYPEESVDNRPVWSMHEAEGKTFRDSANRLLTPMPGCPPR